MSLNKQTLMPEAELKVAAYTQKAPNTLYEGVKARVRADMEVVESCFGKCNVSFQGGAGLGEAEQACMSRCYNKFLNCSMVARKELSLYTIGMDQMS